jgi:hypothetical protein
MNEYYNEIVLKYMNFCNHRIDLQIKEITNNFKNFQDSR